MRKLQSMPLAQRRFIFLTIFVGGLLLLVALFVLLSFGSLNSAARTQGRGLAAGVLVRPFAALPDDDAYPSSVAVGEDGTVYTGSFASGAVWAITPDGAEVTELPGTRDAIGAVWSLAMRPDGALLVLDVRDTDPRSGGGRVVRVQDGQIEEIAATADGQGFIAPNDLAVTPDGALYVTDGGRNEVLKFTADASGALTGRVWWAAPTAAAGGPRPFLSGLAYDETRGALIITDPETNTLYRVALEDGATEVLYEHGSREFPPGLMGAAVAEDGALYVAALGQNGIARVDAGTLDYIAGLFRGANDVAIGPDGRLFVPNFDQSALVVPLIAPQLPFAVDVIEFNAPPTPPA